MSNPSSLEPVPLEKLDQFPTLFLGQRVSLRVAGEKTILEYIGPMFGDNRYTSHYRFRGFSPGEGTIIYDAERDKLPLFDLSSFNLTGENTTARIILKD